MFDFSVLRNALAAVNDSGALDRLRANAPQICAALEDEDFILDEELSERLSQHPEWLARVYATLSEDDALESEASEERQLVTAILANEQEVIADAWAELLKKLDEMQPPGELGKWELALQIGLVPGQELLRHLRTYHPSCRKGDSAAERLLQYGLTPGMLFDALREMELLFNGILRRANNEAFVHMCVEGDAVVRDDGKSIIVSQKLVAGSIAGTLDLELKLVPALTRSISCMLKASPLLIDGYCCLSPNTFIKLPDAMRETGFLSRDSLVRRWCAGKPQFVND